MEGSMSTVSFMTCILLVGAIGGAMGCYFMWDMLQIRSSMRDMTGDTRQETMHNIRAQLELMRREYALKPADKFTIELFKMFDSLELTLDRVEHEEFVDVRVG
jgi:hypothetical protein